MVTSSTIQECWWKSTCIKKPVGEGDIERDNQQAERADLQESIAQLPPPAKDEERVSLNEFISPENETIRDEDGEIFETVVERYSVEEEGDEDSGAEGEEVKIVLIAEGLKALETVRIWKLQQENTGDTSTLQALDRIEREMLQSKRQSAKQTSIKSFFQYRD
jgi:hypothetical protein